MLFSIDFNRSFVSSARMSEDILTIPPPPADVRIQYGPDPHHFADLRLPKEKGPHPLYVNIHGGFWRSKYDLRHAGHLCAALTAGNAATANLEYRRVGDDGGGWPGTFADIRSALRFLQQNAVRYNFDTRHIVVMGHSAGGQLAIALTAHEASIQSVVSMAGVLDLQRAFELHLSNDAVAEFLAASRRKRRTTAEADHAASPLAIQQWILHGTKDDVVPPDFSRAYVETKKKKSEIVHLFETECATTSTDRPAPAAWKIIKPCLLQAAQ
jgi:acetyl esterase/lipase